MNRNTLGKVYFESKISRPDLGFIIRNMADLNIDRFYSPGTWLSEHLSAYEKSTEVGLLTGFEAEDATKLDKLGGLMESGPFVSYRNVLLSRE